MGGADDGTLLFWDRRTGNLRTSFQDTHPEAVTQVTPPALSHTSSQLVFATTGLDMEPLTAFLLVPCWTWDEDPLTPLLPRSLLRTTMIQVPYIAGALQVCFPVHEAKGAEWLVSSSADGFINVMDLQGGLNEEEAFRVRPFCNPLQKLSHHLFGTASEGRICAALLP